MKIFSQDKRKQGIPRRRTVVRRTRKPAVWRRDCGKRPFMDGNYRCFPLAGSTQIPYDPRKTGL